MGNFPIAPVRASEFSGQYDVLFYTILALTIIFSVLVGGAVIFLALRYRRGTKVDRSRPMHENLPLEMTWLIVPLVLGLVIFVAGARQFIYYKTPPKDAMEVYVVGKQWMWHIQHAQSGIRENNTLHVPIGVPVKLTMISQDVIHAFYIPEFRLQYHVVPGRYTESWFTATRPGTYHLFCAMYCGTQHSEMGGYVYVMQPREYAAWVANGGTDPQPRTLVERGAATYAKMACANCHGSQDTLRAPSLYGLYGKTRRFTDGTEAVADDLYLRDSIYNPYAHIVSGYGNEMPEYKGQITEEDMLPLVAYIKSLGSTPGKAGSTIQGAVNADQKGETPATTVKRIKPKMAVNALGAEVPVTNGVDRGRLSVGALGSESN